MLLFRTVQIEQYSNVTGVFLTAQDGIIETRVSYLTPGSWYALAGTTTFWNCDSVSIGSETPRWGSAASAAKIMATRTTTEIEVYDMVFAFEGIAS